MRDRCLSGSVPAPAQTLYVDPVVLGGILDELKERNGGTLDFPMQVRTFA